MSLTGKLVRKAVDLAVKEAERTAPKAERLAVKAAPRPKLAVKPPASSPLHDITAEYGRDVARRVQGLVDADAPASEWRATAQRLAGTRANVETHPRAPYTVRPSEVALDPRIENRAKEMGKIQNLELGVTPRHMDPIHDVSIYDFEGHPFVLSMSDLAAAGDELHSINDVTLRTPFSRRGGQDYMFDNPGAVWAADKANAGRITDLARRLEGEYGKPAIYLPWTMGPTSSHFSHMPRGVQYAYADAAMEGAPRRSLSSEIKAILPDWHGFEDPNSTETFMRAEGGARTALNKLMDKYRTQGGLGIGEGTYAVTDLDQLGAPMTTLRNVGMVHSKFDPSPSTHPSYGYAVPGEGRGRLKEKNLGALALMPNVMEKYGYTSPFDFPVGVQTGKPSPMRSLQLKPAGGVLDYDTLRFIERLMKEGSE